MKASKIIGLAVCGAILFLVVFIALTKDGGYASAKEVEAKLEEQKPVQSVENMVSEEEKQLADLKKSAGDTSNAKPTSKLFASKCAACHGRNGEGRFNEKGEALFPTIAGKKAEFILQRLDDYKHDRVKNPLMIGLLQNINEADMRALSDEISKFGESGE